MPMNAIPVFIADRNLLTSQLLAESLGRDRRFEVAAVNPAMKILSLSSSKPGVAVISAELDSGPRKGLYLARSLRARTHDLSIVMILESLEPDLIIASFRSGAKAVFCRAEPLSEFQSCIECASQGRIWAGPMETKYLLEAIQSTPSCDGLGELSSMTKREAQVADLAAQGLSNVQIGKHLGLSKHTVKNHLFRIFDKLNVANRIELLFLMVKGRNFTDAESAFRLLHGSCEASHAAAAEAGFDMAQLMLGMAHRDAGDNLENSDRAAYQWLRMAELNAIQVLEQSRCRISQLTSRLQRQEIQELEQQISEKVQQQKLKPTPAGTELHSQVSCIAKVG